MKISEHRTKKAFTLIELTVAVALLAMMISFSGIIFKISIGSHRLAMANAQIMQKFRAITDQLNRDFSGLCKDAPLMIWFRLDRVDPCDVSTWERFDQIMFFAEGDFSSTRLYNGNPPIVPLEPALSGLPVRGNVARIYYGQAQVYSISLNSFVLPWLQYGDPWAKNYPDPQIGTDPVLYKTARTLSRRRHILTADGKYFIWPTPDPDPLIVAASFAWLYPTKPVLLNDYFEHDCLSLARWKILPDTVYANPILRVCFDSPPLFDTTSSLTTSETIHNLMAEGVGSFAIQWAYWYRGDKDTSLDDRLLWFPSHDTIVNSHFDFMNAIPNAGGDMFGAMFNIPHADRLLNYWFTHPWMKYTFSPPAPDELEIFPYPVALKFTFTLYDSKRIIKERDSKGFVKHGRTFTHIIYLDD